MAIIKEYYSCIAHSTITENQSLEIKRLNFYMQYLYLKLNVIIQDA